MYEFLEYRVEDVMTRDPVTIRPETPLRLVQREFDERNFNGLPVVGDAGELLGVVTKLDVLAAFLTDGEDMFPHYDQIAEEPAVNCMSDPLQTVRPLTPLTRVLEKLVHTRIKSFPVVDSDERLVGIVSREDVLQALRRAGEGKLPERGGDEDTGHVP